MAVIQAYRHAKVDENRDKFTYGRPDLQLLRRFCLDKFGWQQDRADELLVPVLKVCLPVRMPLHTESSSLGMKSPADVKPEHDSAAHLLLLPLCECTSCGSA